MTQAEEEEVLFQVYVSLMRDASLAASSDDRLCAIGERSFNMADAGNVEDDEDSPLAQAGRSMGRELVKRLHAAGFRITRAQ
jgi:hypothetical protein